jgi:quercetin dioxygenase-like cupin family protein
LSHRELKAFALGPDQGEALWILGGLYTFKAMGKDTDGAYTLVEVQGPPGFSIPVHLHEREHEGFYVAEGRATIFLADEPVEVPAGSFAFAPIGAKHTFRLDAPNTRLILLLTPGNAGHEGMFDEMGEPAKERVLPPPPESPPDPERLAAIASRYGTRIVGPPPS